MPDLYAPQGVDLGGALPQQGMTQCVRVAWQKNNCVVKCPHNGNISWCAISSLHYHYYHYHLHMFKIVKNIPGGQ